MKTVLKIAGVLVVSLALIGAGFAVGTQVASAQAAANSDASAFAPGGNAGRGGPGGFAGRHEMRGGGPENGALAEYHDQMQAAVAEALGVTTDELEAAIQSGQTPFEIAEEKGIDPATFREAMFQARADVLAQAVADGKLTQEQADSILAHMKERMEQGFGPKP